MIDALARFMLEHKGAFGLPADACEEEFGFTKFCQRIVQPHTKVIYFTTYRGEPLALLKTVRGPLFNESLRRESEAQSAAPRTDTVRAPRVIAEGVVNGRFVFAEEIAEGAPVSRSALLRRLEGLAAFIRAFPHGGEKPFAEIARSLSSFLPASDAVLGRWNRELGLMEGTVESGFSHGDLGRPNILDGKSGAYVIDWERAGELPFRFIDLVYLLVQTEEVASLEDWNRKAAALFRRLSGSSAASSGLYLIHALYRRLYRKHPEAYREAVRAAHTP